MEAAIEGSTILKKMSTTTAESMLTHHGALNSASMGDSLGLRRRAMLKSGKVGADEATALQGGRAKNALVNPLRSRTVEQSTFSSPLRILAVADDDTAAHVFTLPLRRGFVACAGSRLVRAW